VFYICLRQGGHVPAFVHLLVCLLVISRKNYFHENYTRAVYLETEVPVEVLKSSRSPLTDVYALRVFLSATVTASKVTAR